MKSGKLRIKQVFEYLKALNDHATLPFGR